MAGGVGLALTALKTIHKMSYAVFKELDSEAQLLSLPYDTEYTPARIPRQLIVTICKVAVTFCPGICAECPSA